MNYSDERREKRYCYIQKLITNKKYLIQEEKNMNIKEMNEEIIEKTAGKERRICGKKGTGIHGKALF